MRTYVYTVIFLLLLSTLTLKRVESKSDTSNEPLKTDLDAVQALLHSSDDLIKCTTGVSGSSIAMLTGEQQRKFAREAANTLSKYLKDTPTFVEGTDPQEAVKLIKSDYKLVTESLIKISNLVGAAVVTFNFAYIVAAEETKLEKSMYNACVAALNEDAFASLSAVKFFYGRQMIDGSLRGHTSMKDKAKKLEDIAAKISPSSYPKLDSDGFESALQAIQDLKTEIGVRGKLNTTNSIARDTLINSPTYKMSSRMRATLTCGQASLATHKAINWTRHHKNIAEKSIDQLWKINDLIGGEEGAFRMLSEACEGNIIHKLPPVPKALYVCKFWYEDLMFYSRACALKGSDKHKQQVEADDPNWFSQKFWPATVERRKFISKHELFPLERTVPAKEAIIQTKKLHKQLLDRIAKRQIDVEKMADPGASTEKSTFNYLLLRGKVFVNNFLNTLGGLIETVYANFTRPPIDLFAGQTKKVCLIADKNGECTPIVGLSKVFSLPKSADEKLENVALYTLALGSEMQGQTRISKRALSIAAGMNQYYSYMERKQKQTERELSENLYGDPDLLSDYYDIQIQNFHKRAINQLVKSGIPAPTTNVTYSKPVNIRRLRKRISSLPKKNLQAGLSRRKIAQNNQNKRESVTKMSNNNSYLNDTYNMKDVFIHKNKKVSIFKIISNRYLKKLLR